MSTTPKRLSVDEKIERYEKLLKEAKAEKAAQDKRANEVAEKEILQHCRAYAQQHGLSMPDAAEKIRGLLFGEQMTITEMEKKKEQPQRQHKVADDNRQQQPQQQQRQQQRQQQLQQQRQPQPQKQSSIVDDEIRIKMDDDYATELDFS